MGTETFVLKEQMSMKNRLLPTQKVAIKNGFEFFHRKQPKTSEEAIKQWSFLVFANMGDPALLFKKNTLGEKIKKGLKRLLSIF